MKLLCLSNGHGEDVITVKIIQQLQHLTNPPDIAALPLVGEGSAYKQLGIPIIAKVQKMPSGGFIYMDGKQLGRDLRGGLLQLTWTQYQAVRNWGCAPSEAKILAVGDIVPLLFAWLSGTDYAFVGTAKSEYYLQDEAGWLPQTSWLDRSSGSVYYPWERWFMDHQRCRAIFPRDGITTEVLRKFSLPAIDAGNPMMDGIETDVVTANFNLWQEQESPLVILLLPGSREPEAQHNWQQILCALSGVIATFPQRSLVFLAAIATSVNLKPLQKLLLDYGWKNVSPNSVTTPIKTSKSLTYSQLNATLILAQNAYHACLQAADFAIAMAGTATEQFVGLGKPVITMPGKGPQFTYRFAEAQTRLLGPSVTLVKQPEQLAAALKNLLIDPDRLKLIAANGRRRMGYSGASQRIAECLQEKLLAQ